MFNVMGGGLDAARPPLRVSGVFGGSFSFVSGDDCVDASGEGGGGGHASSCSGVANMDQQVRPVERSTK